MSGPGVSATQFEKLYGTLKQTGGFSSKVGSTHKATHGYMVSLPDTEQQFRSENVTPANLEEFVRTHADHLKDPNRYVGAWDNTETGETSLDVSRNIKSVSKVKREYGSKVADADARTSAMDLSEAGNQEAAWDVRKKTEIPNKGFQAQGRRGEV